MDLEQAHKDYYDFVKPYKESFKVVDKATKKEWTINSINGTAEGLKNSLEIVSVLSAELDDSKYWAPKQRVHLDKSILQDMITIGKVNSDFLCLDKDNAVWDICMDPREATMLAPNFKDWKIEVLSTEGLAEDESLKAKIIGKWIISNGETFIFKENNKSERQINNFIYEYEWKAFIKNKKKYLLLIEEDYEDEICLIKKLDDKNLHFIEDNDKIICTKASN